jgi:hypothetical protein
MKDLNPRHLGLEASALNQTELIPQRLAMEYGQTEGSYSMTLSLAHRQRVKPTSRIELESLSRSQQGELNSNHLRVTTAVFYRLNYAGAK